VLQGLAQGSKHPAEGRNAAAQPVAEGPGEGSRGRGSRRQQQRRIWLLALLVGDIDLATNPAARQRQSDFALLRLCACRLDDCAQGPLYGCAGRGGQGRNADQGESGAAAADGDGGSQAASFQARDGRYWKLQADEPVFSGLRRQNGQGHLGGGYNDIDESVTQVEEIGTAQDGFCAAGKIHHIAHGSPRGGRPLVGEAVAQSAPLRCRVIGKGCKNGVNGCFGRRAQARRNRCEGSDGLADAIVVRTSLFGERGGHSRRDHSMLPCHF